MICELQEYYSLIMNILGEYEERFDPFVGDVICGGVLEKFTIFVDTYIEGKYNTIKDIKMKISEVSFNNEVLGNY